MGGTGAFTGTQVTLKKWRLFRATDYLSMMWPCFEVSKAYGLFPYKVNSALAITSSRAGYVFATMAAFGIAAFEFFILYEMDVSRRIQYRTVPGALQGNCYLLLSWTIAIVSYFNSSKRMKLLASLSELSSRLPTYSFVRISRIIHAKDIFGFLFLVGQAPNMMSYDPYLVASKALGFWNTLVVYLMDTLYVDSVIVLRSCFERINDNLLALKSSIGKEEPHLLRRVYHEQKNPLILLEIRALKKQHNEVSEAVQELNSTFSLQIVASVTLTFAEITFSLYFYILQVATALNIDFDKQIWYSYFMTSVTYYALKLVSIVWACETARNQAARTGILVHEILIDTTDREVKGELQLFSLQLLHRDNSFQAKGLSVDATLITTIVGGITTYLLILIQFLVSSRTCQPEFNSTVTTPYTTTTQ